MNLKRFCFALISLLFVMNNANAMEFQDVQPGFWAYNEIDFLSDESIIDGYPDNTFLPNNLVTRAEFSAMVIKAIKQEGADVEKMYSFEDINNTHWAWEYVLRALNLDILKPLNDSYFGTNDYITRSEIITFLVNILKSEDITKEESISALQKAFDDFDDIPDWFKVTAGKAEILNIIAKEPPRERYLDCDKYVSRAQMAVFLARLKQITDGYIQEKKAQEKAPKYGEGIVTDNVYREGDIVTIPEKTLLPIMVSGQISTKDSIPGEMFQAKFANNIVDLEHHLLLSKDIVLVGKILNSKKAISLIRNGEILFELSAANKNNNYTRIMAVGEYEATSKFFRGNNFVAKSGETLYVRLYKPVRVNIVTGEILD